MYWVEGNVSEVLDPLTPSVLLPPAMLDGVTREGLNAKIGNTEGIFYPIVRIKETELNPYLDLNILGEEIWGWFDVKTKVPD